MFYYPLAAKMSRKYWRFCVSTFRCSSAIRILTLTMLTVNAMIFVVTRYNPKLLLVNEAVDSNVKHLRFSLRNASSEEQPTHCLISEIVHLALVVLTHDEARHAPDLIKTVLHFRRVTIQIHVAVTDETYKTMDILFRTWELSHVNYKLYLLSKGLNEHRLRSLVKFKPASWIPESVATVIFVDVRLRLVTSIDELWLLASDVIASTGKLFGLVLGPPCDNRGQLKISCMSSGLIVYNMKSLRNSTIVPKLTDATNQDTVNAVLSSNIEKRAFSIDCSWVVELQNDAQSCTSRPIKGLLLTDQTEQFTGSLVIESVKETIRAVVNMEPPVLWSCFTSDQRAALYKSVQQLFSTDECAEFRYVASLPRRTHLYYIGDQQPWSHTADVATSDITLSTQLTIDRFSTLERLLQAWKGPASVVFHVSDAEVHGLEAKLRASVLWGRKMVAYHVVYKRLLYNPINYLRNVALNNSLTSHVFFVDVDLVPSADLYDYLKNIISAQKQNTDRQQRVALVVPAFEAFTDLRNLPSNKTELLNLMRQDKLSGYSMKRAWHLGHGPTDYARWVNATAPYDVKYGDAFEPYVVVPSDTNIRFNERLLERMADKAIYIRNLHAEGYALRVLPNGFVLHVPHPRSPGFSQLWSTKGYHKCASIISDESKAELRQQFPNAKF